MKSQEWKSGKKKNALVIGGSVAGLLAARTLSDCFDTVTILDRDNRPSGAHPRKGAPQGAHIHVLLEKGRSVLERLFPGFFEELVEMGAVRTDSLRDMAWFHGGVWKAREPSGIYFYLQSRPLVEWNIRRRTEALSNVVVKYGVEAEELLIDRQRNQVSGVRVSGASERSALEADLVVDASGRASRMSRWLKDAGYDEPQSTTVGVDIAYASRVYRRPPNRGRDWMSMIVYPRAPEGKRLGYIFPIEPDEEGERWIVSMAGFMGEHPSTDADRWMEFARLLERPDIYEHLQDPDARPITPVQIFKFPANRRLHFQKCKRLPGSFLVIGDALCSFNPIYGQGMSVACIEIETLQDCLAASPAPETLTGRFFRKVAPRLDDAWMITTNEDFRYPEAIGNRPASLRLLGWYTQKIHRLAGYHGKTAATFMAVCHFVKRPLALFSPSILWRVLAITAGVPGRFLGKHNPCEPHLKHPEEGLAMQLFDASSGRSHSPGTARTGLEQHSGVDSQTSAA